MHIPSLNFFSTALLLTNFAVPPASDHAITTSIKCMNNIFIMPVWLSTGVLYQITQRIFKDFSTDIYARHCHDNSNFATFEVPTPIAMKLSLLGCDSMHYGATLRTFQRTVLPAVKDKQQVYSSILKILAIHYSEHQKLSARLLASHPRTRQSSILTVLYINDTAPAWRIVELQVCDFVPIQLFLNTTTNGSH